MHDRVKILHLVVGLGIGGLERVVVNLLSALNGDKYDLVVCCLDNRMALAEEISKKGIRILCLNRKETGVDYGIFLRLSRLLRTGRVQILHTHNYSPYFFGVPAALLAGTPHVVHTEHGRVFPDRWMLTIFNRLFAFKLNRVVAVSRALKRDLARYEKIPEHKLQVIPNGVPLRSLIGVKAKEAKRRRLGFRPGEILVGNVARLVPVKNHRCLLRAMPSVTCLFPSVRLIIVGDGPERPRLERLAAELNLKDKVLFMGEQKNIWQLLEIFDLFVLSSFSEGVSMTLLEAMVASKAIVATRVGGNSELIHPDRNGLLVPSDDPEALAKAILRILKDPELAQRLGRMARLEAEKKYSLGQMARSYERVYAECFCPGASKARVLR